MSGFTFTDVVDQSFQSGPTQLREAGLESDAFQDALDKVTEDGKVSEQEGYDLAQAYNRGLQNANDADDDTSNDAPLLTDEEMDDVAARGTEAKGYVQRSRERLQEIMDGG